MQEVLNSGNYTWALAHGDFHTGQIMVGDTDHSDQVLLDWEFSGFTNPGIDLATWFIAYPDLNWVMANENDLLLTYLEAIASEGVDTINDYNFEQLKSDYLYYGTSHALVRCGGVAGLGAAGGKKYLPAVQ